MNTTRCISIITIMVLLTPTLVSNAVGQYGLVDPPEIDPPRLQEDEPLVPTGIYTVDRRQEEAQRTTNKVVAMAGEIAASIIDPLGDLEPIELYTEGFEPTGGHGALGEWTIHGSEVWNKNRSAAYDGDFGFTNADQDGGTYQLDAESLLVSPELDLRTGLGARFFKGSDTSYEAVWDAVYGQLNDGGYVIRKADEELPPQVPRDDAARDTAADQADRARPPQPYYHLETHQRYNLADDRDSVDVWIFTEPPSGYIASCNAEPTCHEVQRFEGSQDWEKAYYDLTPWAEERVWIGYRFQSEPTQFDEDTYFESFFSRHDFFGLQLDEFTLRTPAPPMNIQVRELDRPGCIIEGCRSPTLAPQDNITVETFIRNTGLTDVTFQVTVDIVDPTGSLVTPNHRWVTTQTMSSGQVLLVHHQFDALDQDQDGLEARVMVQRVDGTQTPGVLDGLEIPNKDDVTSDGPDPYEETGQDKPPVSGEDLEPDADPDDDRQNITFDIKKIQDIALSPSIERSASWVESGEEDLRLQGWVENRGTVKQTVTVLAELVDLDLVQELLNDPEAELQDAIVEDFLLDHQAERMIALDPGERRSLHWDVPTSTKGQFHLLVRTDDQDSIQAEDFAPPSLRPPFRSTFIEGAIQLDGDIVADPAWEQATTYPIQFDVENTGDASDATLHVMNNATHLFFGLKVHDTTDDQDNDYLRVYFDDMADGDMTPGAEDGVNLTAGAWQDTHYAGLDDQRRLVHTPDDDKNGGAVWVHKTALGEYSAEVVRPLGTGGEDLNASFEDQIRFLIRGFDGNPAGLGMYRFPANGLVQDGEGNLVAVRDGDLSHEVHVTWALLELATPQDGTIGDRRLSAGFGIDRGPPPIQLVDAADGCPSDWTIEESGASGPRKARNLNSFYLGKWRLIEGWNCGPFEPEQRNLIYQGVHPDSTCPEGIECLPYGAFGSGKAILYTSPVRIDRDIEDPVFTVLHQYATDVRIQDVSFIDGQEIGGPASFGIGNVLWAELQTYNPTTGQWGGDTFLVPQEGYDTEVSVGISDRRNGPTGRNFGGGACDEVSDHAGVSRSCGWWHPTGPKPQYRPADQDLATGAEFTSSPWTLDQFSLQGDHPNGVDGEGQAFGGTTELDLAGETVRVKLTYDRSVPPGGVQDSRLPNKGELGWRIAAAAVTDGRPVSNLAIQDVSVDVDYDHERLGVGPDTSLPVRVTVSNTGVLDADPRDIHLTGLDISDTTAKTACSAQKSTGTVLAGQTVTVRLQCDVPDVSDAILKVRATLDPGDPDDFSLDDEQELPDVLSVRRSPDATIHVDVTPKGGSPDVVRSLAIEVENTGNIPLQGFSVNHKMTQDSTPVALNRANWTVQGTVPVGERMRLEASALDADPTVLPTKDLLFQPPVAGQYRYNAWVGDVSGDIEPTNDRQGVVFTVRNVIYQNDLEGPPQFLPGIITGTIGFGGTPDVWAINEGTLLAGDPVTGDLPAAADAWVTLPEFDLTSARDATFTMQHGFDLEEGYDAGRVEISTDGGATWRTLHPETDPLGGLPDGHPTVTLTGSNAMLDGSAQEPNAAFTGDSSKLSATEDREWLATGYSLGSDPGLRQTIPLFASDLKEFSAIPEKTVTIGGQKYRTDPTWTLLDGDDEAGIDAQWLLEDIRRNHPAPRSEDKMWWSGSPGEFTRDKLDRVETRLEVPVNLTAARGPDEKIILSFWDWRAGWQDTDPPGLYHTTREGVGGNFDVRIHDDAGVVHEVSEGQLIQDVKVTATQPDGWTRRELDLTEFQGEQVDIVFNYSAIEDREDIPFDQFSSPKTTNNLGWLIDDIHVQSFIVQDGVRILPKDRFPFDDLEGGLVTTECNAADDGVHHYRMEKSSSLEPSGEPSIACWSLVSRTSGVESAWHVDKIDDGPDGTGTHAWTIRTDNDQGYPNRLNNRLITPALDLTRFAGDQATLRFDHRFQFESIPDQSAPIAVDGGVVEYQTFDSATGTWGEWRHLPSKAFPEPLNLHRVFFNGHEFVTPEERLRFEATGYNGIYRGLPHPSINNEVVGNGAEFPRHKILCHRSCPDVTLGLAGRGERGMLGSFVFTGDSDGWEETDWDLSGLVGEKVRFAFHAWSDPSYRFEDPLLGWDIANVAVDGEVFQGAPIQLRLRTATDGSVTHGQWTVDDLEVAGDLYKRNLGIQAPGPKEIRTVPGSPLTLEADITNFGTEIRTGVAVAVASRSQDPSIETPTIQWIRPAGESIDMEDVDILTLDDVKGPFTLDSASKPTSTLPVTLQLQAPDDEGSLVIELRLLEDHGEDVEQPDGSLEHVPLYTTLDDEVSGNTIHRWQIITQEASEAEWVADEEHPGRFIDVRGGLGTDDSVALDASFKNTGTLTTDVDVDWAIHRIAPGNGEGEKVAGEAQRFKDISAGEVIPVSYEFTPTEEPVQDYYRVNASVQPSGGDRRSVYWDFPFGRSGVYFSDNFTTDPGASDDWDITGTDNAQTEWSRDRIPGWFIWGRHPFETTTYCDALGCSTGQGWEGSARSPVVDLRRTLNNEVNVILTHSAGFAPGSVGHMTAAVVPPESDNGWEVVPCEEEGGDPTPILIPTQGASHDGQTLHAQKSIEGDPGDHRNPWGAGIPGYQKQGSLQAPVTSIYDLQVQPSPCSEDGMGFIGNTVGFALNTGIMNRPIDAGSGWQIDSLAITSQGIEFGPITSGAQAADRVISIERGVTKDYLVNVKNIGVVHDTINLSISDTGSLCGSLQSNGDCIRIGVEEVSLGPGKSTQIPMTVTTSEHLPTGTHTINLQATSETDAAIRKVHKIQFNVDASPRSDLALQVGIDGGTNGQFEQGRVIPVHATVFNIGDDESKHADVQLRLKNDEGHATEVGTFQLEPLCPENECGSASRHTVTFEWVVPQQPGDYNLSVEIDPTQKLLETSTENNQLTLPIEVIKPQIADLEMESLVIEGTTKGGFAEEGELLKIVARVANTGEVVARNVQIILFSGSLILAENTEPMTIHPGQSVELSASKVARGDGESVIRAVTVMTEGKEIRADNNELSRLIRIRSHDFSVDIEPDQVTAEPGDVLNLLLNITNEGNSVERVGLEMLAKDGWSPRFHPDGVVSVPPGGSTPAILTVAVPKDIQSGAHRLDVVAQSTEASSHAAAVTSTIEVTKAFRSPQIEVMDLTTAPGVATVAAQVQNPSNFDLNLSIEPEVPHGWKLLSEHLEAPPLSNETHYIKVRVPQNATINEHKIPWTFVDPETGWNTTSTSIIDVQLHVGIEAEWIGVTGVEKNLTTTSYTLAFTLANTGNHPATVNMTPVRVPAGNLISGLAPNISVEPSQTVEVDLTFQTTHTPQVGQAAILVEGVGPASKSVSPFLLPLPELTRLPDLMISEVELGGQDGEEVHAGEPTSVRIKVENQGEGASAPTDLLVFIDGTLVNIEDVPSIRPGDYAWHNTTWMPETATNHTIEATLDSANSIAEVREYDNSFQEVVQVKERPWTDKAVRTIPFPVAQSTIILSLLVLAIHRRRNQ